MLIDNPNFKAIPSTNKREESFVGIRIKDNFIEFHYPETYNLSVDDKNLRKDIINILRTVSLAKTKKDTYSEYYTEHHNIASFPLSAYLWIINDYLTFGRYENKETSYNVGINGKVSWKRTMMSEPIISHGNVVYTTIVSETNKQQDNLLTEIYNFCVKKSVDSVGWLYSIGFDTNGIDYYRRFNKRLYLNAVNMTLTHTFNDNKKIRLQQMKNIITGLDDCLKNTNELNYGVESYEYVYECMIDRLFSNISDIREFYPKASWYLIKDHQHCDTAPLRPDTILIRDRDVYILDSKYYRYGVTFDPNDLPDTTSIQKQITYGDYVSKAKKGQYNTVFNAFLLPYSRINNKSKIFSDNIEFVGFANAEWSFGKTHSNIAAILIDMNFLVNNWVQKNRSITDKLTDMIEINVRSCLNG